MAPSQAQWHQGNTQLRQNFPGLHHKQESQASTSFGTGCRPSTPLNFSYGPQSGVNGSDLSNNPGIYVGIAGQTFPLDYQSEMVKHYPRLASLLKCEIPKDLEFVQNTPRPEEMVANVKLKVSPPISDTRSSKSHQVQYSPVALNLDKARTQNLHHSSLFRRNQPSTENVSPVGENSPPTNAEIREHICKRVSAEFKNLSSQVNGNCRPDSLRKEFDVGMSQTNRTANLHATRYSEKRSTATQSPNCTVVEKCATTTGQALEDISEGGKGDAKFNPKCPDTDYHQIIGKVAANYINEDGSPVVHTAMSEITLDELTDQHQSSLLKCSSPEEHKSNDLNINKNMDNMDGMSGSSWPTDHMTDSEKQNTALETLPALLHNLASSVKEQTGEAGDNETFDEQALEDPLYEDISDCENMSQLTCYDPQYEIISEDENSHNWNSAVEMPTLTKESEPTNKLSSYRKGSCRHVQDLTLRNGEIISNEETIPAIHYCSTDSRFSASDNGSNGFSFPKYDGRGHQKWQTNVCSPSSALEDGTDYQLDDNWIIIPIIVSDLQTEDGARCRSSSPALALQEVGEIGHKDIKIDTSTTLSGLQKAVPSGFFLIEEFDTKESFQEAMFLQNSNMLDVASGSPSVHELDSEREFDTSQKKVEYYSEPEDSCDTDDSCNYPTVSKSNFLTVSKELVKPNTAKSSSSSKKETEDDVANVKKGQPKGLDKLAFHKLGRLVNAKRASEDFEKKALKKDDVIVIDSDTEEEIDLTYEEKVQSKQLFSPVSDSKGEVPCGQQKTHSPETVGGERKIKEHRRPSAESPESHQYDCHGRLIKEVMQNACPDQHNSTEDCICLNETQACSELRGHYQQRIVRNKSLINLDSESDEELDQNYTQGKRKDLPRSMQSGTAQRKRKSTLNSAHGTAKEKYSKMLKCHDRLVTESMEDACSDQPDSFKERERPAEAKDGSRVQHITSRTGLAAIRTNSNRSLSSESEDGQNASFAQHQSECCDRQGTEIMEDACFDKLASAKDGEKLIDAESGSKCVKHITSRGGFAAERRNPKRSLSSESEDRQTASFATKNTHMLNLCGRVDKKPERKSWSSGNATKKQTNSSDDVESSLNIKPVIPCLLVSKSSQSSGRFTLSKYTPIHIDGNDETPEITRCVNESQKRNPPHSNRRKKVRFSSQEKPATNDNSTKNEAKLVIPKSDSTKNVLPRQDGSSSIGCLSSTYRQHSEVGERFAPCNGISQSGKTSSKQSILIQPLPLTCHRDKTPRQRRNSQKSDTPLMKSAIAVALQRTKDIKQLTPKIPSYTVSEAYKWAAKQPLAKPASLKGFK